MPRLVIYIYVPELCVAKKLLMGLPFKSKICVEFIIALPISSGVKKITSYVTFIQDFICRLWGHLHTFMTRLHSCQGQMFHGSEICWALTLVTDTSSTSSLININLLHRTCHAYIIYVRYTHVLRMRITPGSIINSAGRGAAEQRGPAGAQLLPPSNL